MNKVDELDLQYAAAKPIMGYPAFGLSQAFDICDRFRANIVDAGSLQVRLASTLISAALEAA